MCVFCEIIKGSIPSYKVYEDDKTLAILDISQATKGHCLVLPKNHVENYVELSKDDQLACMQTIQKVTKILKNSLKVDNFNLLSNCGELAGQSVMHCHFHIIPRYEEDSFVIKQNGAAPSQEELKNIYQIIKK